MSGKITLNYMSSWRMYWILIAFSLVAIHCHFSVCQLQSRQTARQSLNCLRFVYLSDDALSILRFSLIFVVFFLWHFQMSDLSGSTVWPWLSCNEMNMYFSLCVSPKVVLVVAAAAGHFSFVFILPSTQHFARLLQHVAWNAQYFKDSKYSYLFKIK